LAMSGESKGSGEKGKGKERLYEGWILGKL
jgi:hypothetical protein